MKEIVSPDGKRVHAYVSVENGILIIKSIYWEHQSGLIEGSTIRLDATTIPQLRQILVEAEFFKCI